VLLATLANQLPIARAAGAPRPRKRGPDMASKPARVRSEQILFRWRDAFLGEQGPRSPTTRYVLLMLSLHMAMDGSKCFPSMKHIASRSGLSEKAVKEHMARAEAEGWICRSEFKTEGRDWRHYVYGIRFPIAAPELVTDGDDLAPPQAGNPGSEGGHPGSEGGHPRLPELINKLRTDSFACREESLLVPQGKGCALPETPPQLRARPASRIRSPSRHRRSLFPTGVHPIAALVGAVPAEAMP